MERRNKKRTVTLPFVLLIILFSLISPITTELAKGGNEDQISISFDPRPNEPPSAPLNPDPPNGSVDVRVPVTLSVDVYDETGDFVDVYFYNATNDTLIGIDYNVPSDWSTASVVWNEPIKGRICYWYAKAKDHNFFGIASETWIFATRPNQPSMIHNNEYPQNTSTNIPLNVTCHIEVSDEDEEDNLTIYWYENTTGSWVERQNNSPVKNGTYYWTFTQATNYSTTYWWKVVVNDSMHNTTAIFHFTTVDNQPLKISKPIPANQTVNVSKATPYWYVTIEDPENDTFNWTIETSPYIGNASGNNDVNGQKVCPLSGVDYNTTYTVYVNATDSVNGTWVNETFWFITAEQEAPTISNEYPPHRNTHIDFRPTCHVDVHDIEGDNLTVYWYENTTGNWTLRQTDSNISANSTVYWIFSQAGSYSTIYYWRVKVYDGTINTTATYYFTTKPKPSTPQPPPGGGGYTPPPNQYPIANITGPHIGYTDETLIFYAYYSYDPDGYIVGYQWDFENDGVYDTDWLENLLITSKYSKPGNYTIRLQVEDDDGAITTSDPHSIQIIQLEPPLQLPIPQINGPYYGYTNENVEFSSQGSYDPNGEIVNYTWDFGDSNKSYLENPVHSYAKPGNYTVILTVTDNDNLSNSSTTKAVIIDREIKEPEERELPLTLLLLLLMIAIVTILVLFFYPRRYRFTLLVEELNASKKRKNKKRIAEIKTDKKTNKNVETKVNKSEDIHSKVDSLLSELDKNQ
jgi:PKD repeat protein